MYESNHVIQEVGHKDPVDNGSTKQCNQRKYHAENFCPATEIMSTYVRKINVFVILNICHITATMLSNVYGLHLYALNKKMP